jgi:hypothetical protein
MQQQTKHNIHYSHTKQLSPRPKLLLPDSATNTLRSPHTDQHQARFIKQLLNTAHH